MKVEDVLKKYEEEEFPVEYLEITNGGIIIIYHPLFGPGGLPIEKIEVIDGEAEYVRIDEEKLFIPIIAISEILCPEAVPQISDDYIVVNCRGFWLYELVPVGHVFVPSEWRELINELGAPDYYVDNDNSLAYSYKKVKRWYTKKKKKILRLKHVF